MRPATGSNRDGWLRATTLRSVREAVDAIGVHGFESRSHYEQFLCQVQQGDVSLKFAFSGAAAITHDRLARSAGYQSNTKSVLAELEAFKGLDYDLFQWCDVGPGNGQHTAELLRLMADAGLNVASYLALDFSADLLTMALREVHSAAATLRTAGHQWDLEEEPTRRISEWRQDDSPVVATLLGITLGNLLDVETSLNNLWSSLETGDIVVIEVATAPPGALPDSVLSSYDDPIFHAAVLEPFLMAGADKANLDLEVRTEGRAVVSYVTFDQPLVSLLTGLPVCGRGHRVRAFTSRRFDLASLQAILEQHGFIQHILPNIDDAGHAMLVTKRMDTHV